MSRFIVAVPSITPQRVSQNMALYTQIAELGGEVVIIGNSHEFENIKSTNPKVHILTNGENNGFAGSINLVASWDDEWDWILLLNDDVLIDTKSLGKLQIALANLDTDKWIVNCDPGLPRSIPNIKDVFMNLSLFEAVKRKLPNRNSTSEKPVASTTPNLLEKMPTESYASFSITAISRGTWELIGSLDEEMPFCYEDADYTKRCFESKKVTSLRYTLEATHDASSSTKSNINRVLPVVVYSALKYLEQGGVNKFAARSVSFAALLIRIPLITLNSAPKGKHLQGIFESLKVILSGRRPKLPNY